MHMYPQHILYNHSPVSSPHAYAENGRCDALPEKHLPDPAKKEEEKIASPCKTNEDPSTLKRKFTEYDWYSDVRKTASEPTYIYKTNGSVPKDVPNPRYIRQTESCRTYVEKNPRLLPLPHGVDANFPEVGHHRGYSSPGIHPRNYFPYTPPYVDLRYANPPAQIYPLGLKGPPVNPESTRSVEQIQQHAVYLDQYYYSPHPFNRPHHHLPPCAPYETNQLPQVHHLPPISGKQDLRSLSAPPFQTQEVRNTCTPLTSPQPIGVKSEKSFTS